MIVAFPNLIPHQATWEYRSNAAINRSPLTGQARVLTRPGSHLAQTMTFRATNGADRAKLIAFLNAMDGPANVTFARRHGHTTRGTFTQSQLVQNPDFASGTTDWVIEANPGSSEIAVIDGLFRIRSNNRVSAIEVRTTGFTAAVGVPYLARCYFHARNLIGNREAHIEVSRSTSLNAEFAHSVNVQSFAQRHSIPFVQEDTGSIFASVSLRHTGTAEPNVFPQDLWVSHFEVSRCALIDVPENLLLRSEQFDNAAWTATRASVTADQAEFGNENDADELIENGDNDSHFLTQDTTKTADEEMVTGSIFVKRGAGTRNVRLTLLGTTSSDSAWADFTLSGSGTVSGISVLGNFVLARATITPVTAADDTDWYRITVSATTDNATDLSFRIHMLDGSLNTVYAGDSTSSLYLFGAQLQRSYLAGRYYETSSATIDGESASNPGDVVTLKGLPASTDDLFLAGEALEFVTKPTDGSVSEISQLCTLNHPLSSDEYGIAEAHIMPRLHTAPVITTRNLETSGSEGQRIEPHVALWRPQMRARLEPNSVQWNDLPGGISSATFTLIEDYGP